MEPSISAEEAAKALIKMIFRMCRDLRTYQLDISQVARELSFDYAGTKKLVSLLEREGYVETLTFGQKVALTDAGLVLAQRLIH